jgi:hypothetical protein
MTERISWYRTNAEKCLALAHRFRDPKSKRALLAMANAWLAMAEQSTQKSNTLPADTPPQLPISDDARSKSGSE